MKRVKTKEQAQLVHKMNAYILPLFGVFFLYLAFEKQEWSSTSIMLVMIGILLFGYGIFRVHFIQKLMKEVDDISEEEFEHLQKDKVEDE